MADTGKAVDKTETKAETKIDDAEGAKKGAEKGGGWLDDIEMGVQLTEEQVTSLKRQFELNKVGKGKVSKIPLNKVRKVMERAGLEMREQELNRMINLADIVCGDEDFLTWHQLENLATNKVDVNMLFQLFQFANTDTEFERVEFFLDVDEMFNLFQKIGLDKTKEEIDKAVNDLDDKGDRDGKIDWEEFLSVCGILLGSAVAVDQNDPDGTDFNQLRDSTQRMKENMSNTKAVKRELARLIVKKKAEIEAKIKDTTLEDIRGLLKKEWDDKDTLELGLLDNKKDNFLELAKLLEENDKEKQDLCKRFTDTCAERDMVRDSIDQKREGFRQRFKQHFTSFDQIFQMISAIDEGATVVNKGLEAVEGEEVEAQKIWEQCKEYEIAPKVSASNDCADFLRNQTMVISEIKTKMEMMQRERDKYEDMIAEEMERTKAKRMECVVLNMQITNLESTQLVIEMKYQEQSILTQTLGKELEDKEGDTDSKKVKGLRNTVFQFNEEKEVIVEQVAEVQMKLRQATTRQQAMSLKCDQLNIELGELKILLEQSLAVDNKWFDHEDH